MTEIKKITKIVLIYYGIAGLFFAFSYLVLTNFFAWQLMQWPYNDPVTFWSLGVSLLVLSIASFLAYFKKQWEEIKLYFEIMIMWIIGILIMNICIVALLNLAATPLIYMIFNISLMAFNLIVGLISWFKQ